MEVGEYRIKNAWRFLWLKVAWGRAAKALQAFLNVSKRLETFKTDKISYYIDNQMNTQYLAWTCQKAVRHLSDSFLTRLTRIPPQTTPQPKIHPLLPILLLMVILQSQSKKHEKTISHMHSGLQSYFCPHATGPEFQSRRYIKGFYHP